ncbi:MAG: hypothetical protein GY930_01230 [bacterium]|nr:hypothetical protein [bacterium]
MRERLCRYISRPPLAQGRLSLTDEGQVLWKLRSPWRNGTKAFRFDPLVFIERLVAILPHPREHLPHLPRSLRSRGLPAPPHRAPAVCA